MAQATDDDNAYRLVIRFGERILEAGFTSAPNLFLLHYSALGLNDAEAMWVIQILRFKWTAEDPYPQQAHLPMSASEKSRRRYARKLRRMGLLFTHRRYYTADTAPRPDLVGKLQSLEYDLSSLFHNLVRLAEWLEAGHPAEDFVVELPRDIVDKVAPDPSTGRPYFHDVPSAVYRRCVAHVAADPGGTAPLSLRPTPAEADHVGQRSGPKRAGACEEVAEASEDRNQRGPAEPGALLFQNGPVEESPLLAQNGIVGQGSLLPQNEPVEGSTPPKATGSFWGRLKEDTNIEEETAMLSGAARPTRSRPGWGPAWVCPPFAGAKDLVDLLRGLGAHEPKLSQVLAEEPDPADVWAWAMYARRQPSLINPAGFVLRQLEHRHRPPPAVLALARLGPAEWEWLAEHASTRVQAGEWPAGGLFARREGVAEDWLVYCHEEEKEPGPVAKPPAVDLPPKVMPLDELWAAALGQLRLQTTPVDYATWLRGSRLGQYDGTWILVARDVDACTWLTHRLAGLIRKTLVGLVGSGSGEIGLEIVAAVDPPGEKRDQ